MAGSIAAPWGYAEVGAPDRPERLVMIGDPVADDVADFADVHLQPRIMTGLFGGEGFIMQKLEGDGWVFVQMGGAIVEWEMAYGEQMATRTGHGPPARKTGKGSLDPLPTS